MSSKAYRFEKAGTPPQIRLSKLLEELSPTTKYSFFPTVYSLVAFIAPYGSGTQPVRSCLEQALAWWISIFSPQAGARNLIWSGIAARRLRGCFGLLAILVIRAAFCVAVIGWLVSPSHCLLPVVFMPVDRLYQVLKVFLLMCGGRALLGFLVALLVLKLTRASSKPPKSSSKRGLWHAPI